MRGDEPSDGGGGIETRKGREMTRTGQHLEQSKSWPRRPTVSVQWEGKFCKERIKGHGNKAWSVVS